MPVLIIITSLSSEPARLHALQAGSDDYLSKPYDAQLLLECIQNNLKRRHSTVEPLKHPLVTYPMASSLPSFPGVGLTASTGGPMALCEVIGGIKNRQAAYFIVVHGPEWMLKTFAPRLQQETMLKVILAEDGMKIEPGSYYLAPGERHLLVKPNLTLGVVNQPPINFVRPAADPLFQTLAQVFGSMSMGVVMTGMGNDGRAGVLEIHQRGGIVLAQDPATTSVSSMPKHAIETGCVNAVVGLDGLASKIDFYTQRLGKSVKS